MGKKYGVMGPICMVQAGSSMVVAGVMSFFPLFLQELCESDSSALLWSGLAAGIAPLASAFFAPFWSVQADRFGPKKVVSLILFCLALASAAVSMADRGWQIFAFRLVQGMAGGLGPICLAVISLYMEENRLSEKLGYFQAASVIGIIFGPLAGGSLADYAGIRPAFLWLSLVPLISLAVVWLQFPPLHYPSSDKRNPFDFLKLAGLLQIPSIGIPAAVQVLCNMGLTAMGPVFPLYMGYLEGDGNRAALAGMAFFLCGMGSALSSFFSGKLLKRFSPVRVLGEAAFFIAFVFCFQWQVTSLAAYMGCWIFIGLGVGLIAPSVNLLIVKSVPCEERPAVLGSVSSLFHLGNGAGPLCSGLLTGLFGFDAAFILSAALFCLAGYLMLRFFHLYGLPVKMGDRPMGRKVFSGQ